MVSSQIINLVLQKAVQVATHSWEYGTVAEALLEWHNPKDSIWNDPFPNGTIPTLDIANTPALSYVKPYINTTGSTLVDGDGSAGDPAALGIPALMIGKTEKQYWDAAVRQHEHLIKEVPRWENGAISHRESVAELWADFVYMAPPFLAYYAVATSNITLLKESANQCKYYRQVLTTPQGPWLHIIGPEVQDYAQWSTGNGWAAAGMSRVIATMKKSPLTSETTAEQAELAGYVKEILDGAISLDTDGSGLLRNYLNDTTWWGEVSGTSILAATALRMARLEPHVFGDEYVEWAKGKMTVVDTKINQQDGIVSPAIDPLDWHNREPYTQGSPEGQSFVGLMHAAWRDLKGEEGQ